MESSFRPLKVAFIHPDLGIGGAERLVVDAALGLQRLGHVVEIITSYHDPDHSFEETNDGTLKVRHVRTAIPRHIRGALHIYLAILRQLHLLANLISSNPDFDVYVVDQLSACIPFLRRLTGKRVVFYCHFPDKLLASGKEAVTDGSGGRLSVAKRLYRGPADFIEEWSTGYSDIILANSRFTASVFEVSFPSIAARNPPPTVVYPGINIGAYDAPVPPLNTPDLLEVTSDRPTFVSLNRFERKKNVLLALEAFCDYLKSSTGTLLERLVIAGGYDPRLQENVDTLAHLRSVCQDRALPYALVSNGTKADHAGTVPGPQAEVVFILNFTTPQRQYLLRSERTIALLYTPGNEHFGIGPVEAMACGLPVIACSSGGPIESLIDVEASPETGTAWLKDPIPQAWSEALKAVAGLSRDRRMAIGSQGRQRARDLFSMEEMARGFSTALQTAAGMGPVTDAPFSSRKLKLALGLTILVAWLHFNAIDLLGGAPALVVLVAAVLFLA